MARPPNYSSGVGREGPGCSSYGRTRYWGCQVANRIEGLCALESHPCFCLIRHTKSKYRKGQPFLRSGLALPWHRFSSFPPPSLHSPFSISSVESRYFLQLAKGRGGIARKGWRRLCSSCLLANIVGEREKVGSIRTRLAFAWSVRKPVYEEFCVIHP